MDQTKCEIKNAIITDTKLGREDHGIFTFMIYIKCDGWGTGIGGYALDYYDKDKECAVFDPKGLELISKILDVVGVNDWEDLKGKYIRIKDRGYNVPIIEIGNIMEDKWINFKEVLSNNQE